MRLFVLSWLHWWRHRTHYDVTEANHALRNILTVHLNNGATRADLRGIPKHCEVTAKAGRQSTLYTGDFDAMFFITRYGINPYSYSGFLWTRCSPLISNRRSGLRPSGFTWQLTWARLAGDVIQIWMNSSPSNHCISHFKAQLAQLFLIQHLICTYWIKGILCGYAAGADLRSARRPLTSRGMSTWLYRVTTKYSYYIRQCYNGVWLHKRAPFASATMNPKCTMGISVTPDFMYQEFTRTFPVHDKQKLQRPDWTTPYPYWAMITIQ